MIAKPQVLKCCLLVAAISALAATSLPSAFAQNAISVLPPVDVNLSNPSASASTPYTFSSNTLSLTCPSTGTISAIVSSTGDGTANVLVDNYINLTVTQGTSAPSGPVNICTGGVVESGGQNDCFTTGYQGPAGSGELTGDDPDGTIASEGGVAPIQIGTYLAPGTNQVKLDLIDTGGYVAAASTYLNTNCTLNGNSAPAQVTGNPISTSTPSSLTQTASYNTQPNQNVQEIIDFSEAQNDNTLTIVPGTIPIQSITPLSLGVWQRQYRQGTSFSTSNCLLHYGELTTAGTPACALYTVVCQQSSATPTGAQCPTSTARNEVFEDFFDGPAFSLPDIVVGNSTFHQGIGFLMAAEGWTGGECVFDPASGLQGELCPKNLLTQFAGPGAYGSKGTTDHPNSTFISVAPVPEDFTDATVWFTGNPPNSSSATVNVDFFVKPPSVPAPNNHFVAAPIASLTYGISPADALPSPLFPIPTDIVVSNTPCPAPDTAKAVDFYVPEQSITFPGDGQYLLHYFATDCAGTEELKFVKTGGAWTTTFYTTAITIDTTSPMIVAAPRIVQNAMTVKGRTGYPVGSKVQASYSCADALSGVQHCGTATYASPVKNSGPVVSTLDTSTPGTKTFTVELWDAAKNRGTSQSITYTVIAP
jgi:hypothetical protein